MAVEPIILNRTDSFRTEDHILNVEVVTEGWFILSLSLNSCFIFPYSFLTFEDSTKKGDKPDLKRKTRKETVFAFVLPVKDDPLSHRKICACGCVKNDQLVVYSAPNTDAITKHMVKYHSVLLNEWEACKNATGDFKSVYAKRDALYDKANSKIKSQQVFSKKLFKNVCKLPDQVLAALYLTIWAVCNAISRLALNDPIFDRYHKQLGITSYEKLVRLI